MVLVSVIVPVYETPEPYLRALLDSLKKQTLQSVEFLLMDDASPSPHIQKILQEYAAQDPRFKPLNMKKNNGVSCARNAALEQAQGKYFGFADADDLLEPDYFARLSAAAEASETDLVLCGFQRMLDDGTILKKRIPRASFGDTPARRAAQFRTLSFSSVNKLFLRERFGALRFCPGLRFGEDVLYVAEAMLKSRRPLSLPYGGYFYRYNPQSATSKAQSGVEAVQSTLILLPALLDVYQNNPVEEPLAGAFRKYILWHFIRYANKFGRIRDRQTRLALWQQYRALFPLLADRLGIRNHLVARLTEKHLCRADDPKEVVWTIFLLRLSLPLIG